MTSPSNAVAVRADKPGMLASIASRYAMDPDEFQTTVARTVMPRETTPEEFVAFLMVCNTYALNPILREIYAFPKKGGGIVPIVSIDGWISLVNSHPKFKGMEFDAIERDGKLVAYTCRIWRTDREMPVVVTEYLEECFRSTDPWKMKHRMLRHKALIQCARYAFGFSGIYDEDEGSSFAEVSPQAPTRRAPAAPAIVDGAAVDTTAGSAGGAAASAGQPEPETKPAARSTRSSAKARQEPQEPSKAQQQAESEGSAGNTSTSSAPQDDYDAEPILRQISEHYDECDSTDRLALVHEKMVLPLHEDLRIADIARADELHAAAAARIASADEAAGGDDAQAGEAEQDQQQPEQVASEEKPREQMSPAEYEQECRDTIANTTDRDVLKKWWFQGNNDRDVLSDKVRAALRDLYKARMDELPGGLA